MNDEREPWAPFLSDRADGVRGHYAIGRRNPAGYYEFWNLRSHQWASCGDEVLTREEALALLREIVIPTAARSLPAPAAQGMVKGGKALFTVDAVQKLLNFACGRTILHAHELQTVARQLAAESALSPAPAAPQGSQKDADRG